MNVIISWLKQREKKIFKIGWSYFSHQGDIEDALHNAIINSYENIHTLKFDQYFETWFIKIFINECRKIYKTNKRTKADDISSYQNIKNEETNEAEKMTLKAALEKLPKETAEYITLKYISGFSHKEIGEMVEKPESTIKSKIHRGLKAIRKYL
nr:sigma-70 family RNA polymerase sigma factor [Bacillus alkalicola]